MSGRRIPIRFRRKAVAAQPKPVHRIGLKRPKPVPYKKPHKKNEESTESTQETQEATPQETAQEAPQEAQEASQEDAAPQEAPQEVPQEAPQEEQEESEEEESKPAIQSIQFPLVSSHLHGETVRTTGLMISNHGCGLVHCDAMPRNLNVGVEYAAPRIASIHRAMLQKLGMRETQKKVAETFIKRARLGDQNALGMMAMVRDNAARGVPNAIASLKIMNEYIQKNPVKPNTGFGFEDECSPCLSADTHGAIMLANGPTLSNSRIRNVAATFGSEDRRVLLEGMRKWQSEHDELHRKLSARLDNMQREILKLGRTLGKARALQIVRHHTGPVAAYSKNAAWELGESI